MSAIERGEKSPLIHSCRKEIMVTDKEIHTSFLWISFLFAINHGALLSCLGLASARLGSAVASASSTTLYVFNTGFALLGAPYIVKQCGPHSGLIMGMCMCATYVSSFWGVVSMCNQTNDEGDSTEAIQGTNFCSESTSIIGSVIGGIGSAILWTSQGSFFTGLCAQYSRSIQDRNIPIEKVTSRLGGEWAFVFLFIEVWMRILSTVLSNGIHTSGTDETWFNHGMDWKGIFGVYSILAFGAAIIMNCVTYYYEEENSSNNADTTNLGETNEESNLEDLIFRDEDDADTNEDTHRNEHDHIDNSLYIENSPRTQKSPFRQAVAAVDLLVHDSKMKYLSFINITFGFCTAFVTLIVNGQVIRVALHDYNSRYVGMFTALSSMVAAVLSWAFGALDWLSHSSVISDEDSSIHNKLVRYIRYCEPNKERILTAGAISYLLIALLFLLFPSYESWSFGSLFVIYILLGIGRSTYEGTLRAVFADFFPHEREGAFSNIILSTGLASVLGFWLAGTSPFALEIATIGSAILAIIGFWKANALYAAEQHARIQPLPTSDDLIIT